MELENPGLDDIGEMEKAIDIISYEFNICKSVAPSPGMFYIKTLEEHILMFIV